MGHKKLVYKEDLLRRQEVLKSVTQAALDSLSANIVILDDQGVIKYTNKSWHDFAKSNGAAGISWSGINYLEVSDNSPYYSESGISVADGIRMVMKGEVEEFVIEYPCHSPREKRWFRMRVTPFRGKGPYSVVISHENITEKKLVYDELDSTLKRAVKLHKEFLPKKLPSIEGYNTAVLYKPSGQVGGDLYNLIEIENKLIFFISDITGHSLDSAMLNIFIREKINHLIKDMGIHSPNEILQQIHKSYIQESFPADYFAAIILGVIDFGEAKIRISNAGIQVPPVLLSKDGDIETLEIKGMLVSSVINSLDFNNNICEKEYKLEMGSMLIISSDGLVEQSNGDKIYGLNNYYRSIKRNSANSIEAFKWAIFQDFKEYAGNKDIDDDITTLMIKRG